MEIVEKESIKVPNSLIISGLSETSVDEEIADYLKQYGKVSRIVDIRDELSEFNGQAIIEFESGDAVQALEPILPLHRTSSSDPTVVHHVKTLASVYSSKAGTETTHTFLSELKSIAKMSGKSFENILQEELTRITRSLAKEAPVVEIKAVHAPTMQLQTENASHTARAESHFTQTQTEQSPCITDLKLTTPEAQPLNQSTSPLVSPGVAETGRSFSLPLDQLSSPEVQRVVVEHVVKSTEIAAQIQSHVKLRTFSGRVPFPNHEVDYDTWRSSVEFYLTDSTVSQSQLVRKMVDSLLPPATHVVKSLGPRATPRTYLDVLDSAYATVEDGDELFAKFLNTHQNSGEKPSDYLHRLQSHLNEVVKKGVVSTCDADKQLLKQFCRGCWNNSLIATLQLEQRQRNPPTFSEFLLMLSTEEDKQAAKVSRMKHHLGLSKAKAQANTQAVCTSEVSEFGMPIQDNRMPSLIEQLQKQISSMQAQIAALSVVKGDTSVKPKMTKTKKANPSQAKPTGFKQSLTQQTAQRPRPWYCFKCGEDGHIATSCNNPPNPTLVEAKREELKEKQKAWDRENTHNGTLNL